MIRKKLLLIDNYDSFTYNLCDYFLQLGADCTVIRNDALSLDEFIKLTFDALVLSPGPKTPGEAGLLMPLLKYFYNKKPILGICLGHQGIGELFGAKLLKATRPMHGKTSVIKHNGHFLFNDLPDTFEVMRYHSLVIGHIENTPLQSIAQTDSGEIMAMAHHALPLIGIQFHPESILTEYGLKILENWLNNIPHRLVIRPLQLDEIPEAYALMKASFLKFNAPSLIKAGKTKILSAAINESAMSNRFRQGNSLFIGAFIKNKMVGAAEMTRENHLRLLYVSGKAHNKGVGKSLIDELQKIIKAGSGTAMTVNSALPALVFYEKYGFKARDKEQEVNGVRFVPMVLDVK